jgi:hypothetical protein
MHSRLIVSVVLLGLGISPAAFAQWSAGPNPIFVGSGVNIGIGTNTPASLLHLAGPSGVAAITFNSPGNQFFRFQTLPGISNWGGLTLNCNYFSGAWNLDDTAQNGWFFKLDGRAASFGTASIGNGLWLYRIPGGSANPQVVGTETPAFGVTNGFTWVKDKVAIGTGAGVAPDSALQVVGSAHITVDLTVDGNLAAKYQDLAEWVPVKGQLSPGTVVVLNPEHDNEVMASSHSYDTAVAGVVSAKPGITLGQGSSDKAKIATTGRVLVHVDATRQAIRIGDLLVTSDKLGVAMRSEPIDINGHKFHQPGTVVGKALQALPSGEGDILVLLSMQ